MAPELTIMHSMKGSRKPLDLGLPLPAFREVQVGFRLRQEDAATLRELANQAGVGHTTLARIIVEKYLADHRAKGKA